MKKILIGCLSVFLFNVNDVIAQGKIGYTSADEVFALMPDTKKADSLLQVYQQSLADSYNQMQNEMNDAYAKFVADSSKLTPAVKEARRLALQEKITELQNKEQQMSKALETEKERLIKPIQEKLMKAIKDIAKENGYAHILYKESAIVFPEADDITAKVKVRVGIR